VSLLAQVTAVPGDIVTEAGAYSKFSIVISTLSTGIVVGVVDVIGVVTVGEIVGKVVVVVVAVVINELPQEAVIISILVIRVSNPGLKIHFIFSPPSIAYYSTMMVPFIKVCIEQ
jgi:hypothetical protein